MSWFTCSSHCEKRPKCTNDGGQFRMGANGRFRKSKRDLNGTDSDLDEFDTDQFEEVEDVEEHEGLPLRQLETEDGGVHLVIADDPEDPIGIGHEIWSEGLNSTVRVVREVE